jgi:tryptophan 2,3-dioxygenase
MMKGRGTSDYELYLNTHNLFACFKDFDQLCNKDELQFGIVHQVEELWMRLIAYTLLDIDEYISQENTSRVLTLFRRVHIAQKLMIEQLALLETMSPKEYQAIRLVLGNGTAAESPGFIPFSQCTKVFGRRLRPII